MDSNPKPKDPEYIPGGLDLSLRHLLAEMARIDVRIQRQVDCWQQAGQDPNDDFRGLYVSDSEVQDLLKRSLATSWGDPFASDLSQEQIYIELEAQATQRAKQLYEQAEQAGIRLRLPQLASSFNLSPFDVDILLICLAPYLDLRYERLYGYLQDDVTRKHPTMNLVLNLLCQPGLPRLVEQAQFHPQAPLFKHHLLVKLKDPGQSYPNPLNQPLALNETIASWLLGHYYYTHPDFAPCFQFSVPETSAEDDLLAGPNAIELEDPHLEDSILIFYGVDQAAKQAAARRYAASLDRPLLEVDLSRMDSEADGTDLILRFALRDARLTGAVLTLEGWDGYDENKGYSARTLADLMEHTGSIILNSESARLIDRADSQRPLYWVEFSYPNYLQRRALWAYFLNKKAAEAGNETAIPIENLDPSEMASQFTLSTAQIRAAVTMAIDRARQSGARLTQADLLGAARVQSSAHLSSLARKISPHYCWQDIVLPEDQLSILAEIIAAVRGRSTVLEAWGVGQKLVSSAGITVLFAGPPGTGKTMAAEIIAAELGLDLYKIDLSTVVSKYIGETEKNLEQIFSEATNSNAILFFDEADALFGKRSEVRDSHDRYANIEISYLLQRMEAYNGVTILATNLRANLDEAFTRRLQFAVDFPLPEEADRLRIWQVLFPPGVPRAPDVEFESLAQRFKLSGGSIRNVIVSSAYLAASSGGTVTMGHLLHGTRRELQKMGKLVEDDDLFPRSSGFRIDKAKVS
jgi:hypothetical protein